jgi:hypothetical protein
VRKEGTDRARILEGRQDPGLLLRLQLADQVGRVVVGHLLDDLGDLLRFELRQEFFGVLDLLHLGERLAGGRGRQQTD